MISKLQLCQYVAGLWTCLIGLSSEKYLPGFTEQGGAASLQGVGRAGGASETSAQPPSPCPRA